jgi:hypothetical protein
MKTEGKGWKWAWWLLAAGVGLQFYFVQELVAAFAFIAIGFAVVGFAILCLHMLQRGWEVAMTRFTNRENLSGPGFATREAGAGDAITACEECCRRS